MSTFKLTEKWTWYKKFWWWLCEKVTRHDSKLFKEWKKISDSK